MKKRVYVMAVMIAVLMSFSNLTVNAQEKVKLKRSANVASSVKKVCLFMILLFIWLMFYSLFNGEDPN